MKKFNLCLLVLCSLLPASVSRADIATETQAFGFELSPGVQILTFAQFDTMGGLRALQSVELAFTASVSADVALENNSGTAAPSASVNLSGGFATTSSPGISTAGSISYVSSPVFLSASDGTPGSGSDFQNFGKLSSSVSASSGVLTASGNDLTPYTGTGSFTAQVDGMGGWSFSGLSSGTLAVTNLAGAGNLTVSYNYVEVPEPGAPLLAAASGLLLIRRRR